MITPCSTLQGFCLHKGYKLIGALFFGVLRSHSDTTLPLLASVYPSSESQAVKPLRNPCVCSCVTTRCRCSGAAFVLNNSIACCGLYVVRAVFMLGTRPHTHTGAHVFKKPGGRPFFGKAAESLGLLLLLLCTLLNDMFWCSRCASSCRVRCMCVCVFRLGAPLPVRFGYSIAGWSCFLFAVGWFT